jgi:hypothetical protein
VARRSLNQKVDAYYDSLKADLQKQKKSWVSKELTPQGAGAAKGPGRNGGSP